MGLGAMSAAAEAQLAWLGGVLGTSDHASVVSINLFVALLCACIVLGHLLEENRWVNESITALIIVSKTKKLWIPSPSLARSPPPNCSLINAAMPARRSTSSSGQGLCTGVVILLTTKGKSSHVLVFSEDLFFIYLLPPIIFNAG